jgi:hypothetical protein
LEGRNNARTDKKFTGIGKDDGIESCFDPWLDHWKQWRRYRGKYGRQNWAIVESIFDRRARQSDYKFGQRRREWQRRSASP